MLKVRKFNSLLGQSALPLPPWPSVSSKRSRPDPNSIFYTHLCATLGDLLKVLVGVLEIGNRIFSCVHPDTIISNIIKPTEVE